MFHEKIISLLGEQINENDLYFTYRAVLRKAGIAFAVSLLTQVPNMAWQTSSGLEAGGLRGHRRSEPSGQRVGESHLVRSPTQATYPSGRINTALGAATVPSAGSSHGPTYLASIN